MIVTISGVDCAGKSTQIEWLARFFDARGHRVARLWFRPGYSEWLNAARRVVRRLAPRTLPTMEQPAARARAFRRPWLRGAWLMMAAFDALGHYAVRVRSLDRLGWIVLCDRYVFDALLDLKLRFPEHQETVRGIEMSFCLLAPRPDATFLLNLSRAEMLARMGAKDEPFPDPPEVRDRRYLEYQDLASRGDVEVIDASESPELVNAAITDRLRARGLLKL